jgi:hypothetical protein
MICSKCGQELKDGAKFCTKCGTNVKEAIGLTPANMALPIISIILSVIGIIISWLIPIIGNNGDWRTITVYIVQSSVTLLIYAGIIVAFFSIYKQKSLIGFVAGLIPCAYLIIVQVYYMLRNMKYF